jgi:hypothetical protein
VCLKYKTFISLLFTFYVNWIKLFQNLITMDLIMKSKQIVERLQFLHKQEKEILSETIRWLGEIRKYKIFSDYQCKDLLEFCQKILGYTESQSHRRIRAL